MLDLSSVMAMCVEHLRKYLDSRPHARHVMPSLVVVYLLYEAGSIVTFILDMETGCTSSLSRLGVGLVTVKERVFVDFGSNFFGRAHC
ncbi:unnamed protein product [Chondrus crispus]|uniref:Uncharacterized protein n=1 Tax=Chondrus crispus TaxID=2769 RepID=R7QPW1_CHOCR|nr:unnamed protein product [Chondrus crispus]CDF39496.1 unnamed protein product [Chondrus crispus]|eukprot:XP_005719407.1 unnamed protein product [Chondrus crispus]